MPNELFDLAARITADTKGADQALTATQKKVLELARQFGSLDSSTKKSGSEFSTLEKQVSGLTDKLKAAEKQITALQAKHVAGSASGKQFSSTLRGITDATSALQGPLGGVASRVTNVGQLFTGMTSAAGAWGIAAGAAAAATVGLAVGIYKLTAAASESTGKLYDLSQQTGFSVETLSALKNAAETSGGSIESISGALGIFQRHMEEANEGNKESARLFKSLNIDIRDNELALRQAFQVLSKFPEGAQQTALSMKLFGRSGREVMAVYKEAGGDLDKFISKLKNDGLLVTTEAAKRSDQLSDSITRMGQQWEALERQIAEEFYPVVSKALSEFSGWLKENQGELVKAAKEIAEVVGWVYDLAKAMAFLTGTTATVTIIRKVIDINFPGGGDLPPSTDTRPKDSRNYATPYGMSTAPDPIGDMRSALSGGAVGGKYSRPPIPKAGGGGGGGGGGGSDPAAAAKQMAALRLAAVLQELKYEEEANKRSLDRQWQDFTQYRNRFVANENARHKAVVDGLAEEMGAAEKLRKAKEREIAVQQIRNKQEQEEFTHKKNIGTVNDQQAKLLDQLNDFLADQAKQIKYASDGTDQYTQAVLDFVEAKKKEGFEIDDVWRKQMLANAARQKEIDLIKQQTRERRAIAERPRAVTDEANARLLGIDLSRGDETRSRRTTDDFRERIRPMVEQLTSLLSNAIHDGFRDGVKRGALEFAQGILQMIETKALDRLSEAITDAILKGVTNSQGGKGGGLLGTILQTVLGVAVSAVGGSVAGGLGSHSSAIGHVTSGIGGGGAHSGGIGNLGGLHSFAVGTGYVPYDMIAQIHQGERIVPASENRQGGGGTFIFNYHAPAGSKVESRETVRQASEKYRRVMQTHALNG